MRFEELPLAGAYRIAPEPHVDERGSFARFWDSEEFRAAGLNPNISQSNLSHNTRRGTLRGLHYQLAPNAEAKLVTCVRGSIWDVMVDLRADSPTFCHWYGEDLSGDRGAALYVPEGFAHGFLTTTDDALVLYQISKAHSDEHSRGVRWNDPAFGIKWPGRPLVIGARDAAFVDFRPESR